MLRSILFDIDGVLLSEERCFDASALAVWELIHSPEYMGIQQDIFTVAPDEGKIREIRALVFSHDEVLAFLKSQGFNSNWDMVFLTFFYQVIDLISQLDGDPLKKALDLLAKPINQVTLQKLGALIPKKVTCHYDSFIKEVSCLQLKGNTITTSLLPLIQSKWGDTLPASDQGQLWELGREVFQEWYVGDNFIEASIGSAAKQKGKKGFLQEEIPLATMEELQFIFRWIYDHGYQIGIGTGRPKVETIEPLRALGLLQWVSESHIVTADEVLTAEELFPDKGGLGKPHPYTYLQSYYGKEKSLEEVFDLDLPLEEGNEILVVGDSVADFYAAKALGVRFAAVLTGLTGKEARNEFEALGATYILNKVVDLIPLLSRLKD